LAIGPLRDLVHIHQTAELAERVLLPGDPGRALRLAQELLAEPKMLNHNRGLWGYTGVARRDGELLSIQSTGMGGPSAAVVVSELVELGARRLLRVGTCGAIDPALSPGQLLVVSEAIADDGTSVAIGPHGPMGRVAPPGSVFQALAREASGSVASDLGGGPLAAAAGPEPGPETSREAAVGPEPGPETSRATAVGPVVSTDLFYDAGDRLAGWRAAGARAVEMEAATVFALAARRGVQAGCALLVSNRVDGDPTDFLPGEALHAAELRLGELAVAALSNSLSR
jgi:uridine phosphorylase